MNTSSRWWNVTTCIQVLYQVVVLELESFIFIFTGVFAKYCTFNFIIFMKNNLFIKNMNCLSNTLFVIKSTQQYVHANFSFNNCINLRLGTLVEQNHWRFLFGPLFFLNFYNPNKRLIEKMISRIIHNELIISCRPIQNSKILLLHFSLAWVKLMQCYSSITVTGATFNT